MSMINVIPQSASIPYIHRSEMLEPEAQGVSNTSNIPIPQNSTIAGQSPLSKTVKELLENRETSRRLAGALREIITRAAGKYLTPEFISFRLKNIELIPRGESPDPTVQTASKSLFTVITELGLELPRTATQINALAQSFEQKASLHPLGNLGGALSWPIPMPWNDQNEITRFLSTDTTLPGLPLPIPGSTLNYLLSGSSVTPADLQDPARALQKLLDSPKAQALGHALQNHLNGASSDTSSHDYVLTAIHLGINRNLSEDRERNVIAGFVLDTPLNWNESTSTIIERLRNHLIKEGLATEDAAELSSYLLLSKWAPQFLIKGIPASVTYGSLAWLNLSVAAAAIEARTPGKVSTMSYVDVMLEAESAAQVDPLVTQAAQREALIDWGRVSGALRKKDDHLYTADELDTLLTTFNARKSEMALATQGLDKDIPSRKAIALAVLKERFPELEAMYENKLLHVNRAERNMHGHISGWRTVEVGPHSLLDIAMMDIPGPDLTFISDDEKRVPVAALNANPSFGVSEAFESQFKAVIKEKKSAIATYIKHLISQLPLEDRKNFELGEITFYQIHSKTLSKELFGSTANPKAEELLLKIKHGDVETEYKIDFNAGRIEKLYKGTATARSSRVANRIYETKVFKPEGSNVLREPGKPPLDGSPIDTFAWDRVQRVADAFVEHINLDDDALKQQARGQTTADKNNARAAAISELLLDLIPFRSAIKNFRAGNIGEGIFDLGLDLFGFLTAGAATAGKVVKIAGTTASRVTKGLQTAKAIGMATFSTLNPLGGLGDLAVGSARLAGQGIQSLAGYGAKAVNTLRGATGNYDLLKAVSKEHGTTLIGTYQASGRSIDTVAVLKNDQWHHYDPVANKVFGSPIKDFTPLGAPSLLISAGTGSNNAAFRHILARAQTPANAGAFQRGLTQGAAHNLPGHTPGMNTEELVKIALNNDLTPEQMGTLAREITDRKIEEAKYVSKLLYMDVADSAVHFTPVSQIDYLARTNITSKGECAGFANLMALAILAGKEDALMQNLYRAARNPADAKAAEFIQEMANLHRVVGDRNTFHMGKPFKRQSHTEIINDLTNSPTSKTVRIATKDHAMIAGIKVEGGKTEWFFYDPNAGLAKFTTLRSMQEGMEKALNNGELAATLNPHKSSKGGNVYETSDFSSGDMDTVNSTYKELLDAAL